MSNYTRVNSEEDTSYEWSFAQICISNAFSKGLLTVKVEDSNGTNDFKPVCLYFGSQGEIDIVVNKALSELANMQPTILLTAEKDIGKEAEQKP